MKVLLILSLCVLLTSAVFPSLSTIFPYFFSRSTRRPIMFVNHHNHNHNRREFGKRTSESELEIIDSQKEIAKKRKFHLQFSFGPIIVPNESDPPTTESSGWLPWYSKSKSKPSYETSSYYGTELLESEENVLPNGYGYTTSVPYQPITWRTTKPTYRTTTTVEPYESEEEILPGGFTPAPPVKKKPFRNTKTKNTTKEPNESEEEILPGGFTTTSEPENTTKPTFPLFNKIKETIPKLTKWKLSLLPKLPGSLQLPIVNTKGKKGKNDTSSLSTILSNWEDWTSLLPAAIRLPRTPAEEVVAKQFFTEDSAESQSGDVKKTKKKPKGLYTPPSITLTPPSKKPAKEITSAKKRPDRVPAPAPSEEEVDIQPGGQKPKPEPPRKKPAPAPAKSPVKAPVKTPTPGEDEIDIQPGGQNLKPRPNPDRNYDSFVEQLPARPAGSIIDDLETNIQPSGYFPPSGYKGNRRGYGRYNYDPPPPDENEQDIQPGGQLPPDGYGYLPPQQPPSKEIYFFAAPREFNPKKRRPTTTKPPLRPKKQVKVIFIKTPDPELPIVPEIPQIPPNPEQKTLVYVVSQKSEKAPNVTIKLPEETASPKPDVYFVRYQVTTQPPDEGEEQIDPGSQKPKGYSYPKPKPKPDESEEDIQPGGQKPKGYSYPKPQMPDEGEEDIQPGGFTPPPTKPPKVYLPPSTYLPPQTTTEVPTTTMIATTMPAESEEDIQPGGQTEGPTTTMPAESEEDIQPGGQTEAPTTTMAPAYLPPSPPKYLPIPPAPYLPPPPKGNDTEGAALPGGGYPVEPQNTYLPLPPVVYPPGDGGYPDPHINPYLPPRPHYSQDYGAPVSNYFNDHRNPYFDDHYGEEDETEEESDEEEDDVHSVDSHHPHTPRAEFGYHEPGQYRLNEWDRKLKKEKKKKHQKYGPRGYDPPEPMNHYGSDNTERYLPQFQSALFDSKGFRNQRKRQEADYRRKGKRKFNGSKYGPQKAREPIIKYGLHETKFGVSNLEEQQIASNYDKEDQQNYDQQQEISQIYNPEEQSQREPEPQGHQNFDQEQPNQPIQYDEQYDTNSGQNQRGEHPDFIPNQQYQQQNENRFDLRKKNQIQNFPPNNNQNHKPFDYSVLQGQEIYTSEDIDPRNNIRDEHYDVASPKYNSIQNHQNNFNSAEAQHANHNYNIPPAPEKEIRNFNPPSYDPPKFNSQEYNAPIYHSTTQYNVPIPNTSKYERPHSIFQVQNHEPSPIYNEPPRYKSNSQEQFGSSQNRNQNTKPRQFSPQELNPANIYTVNPLRLNLKPPPPLILNEDLPPEPPEGSHFDPLNFDPLKFALEQLDGLPPQPQQNLMSAGEEFNYHLQRQPNQNQKQSSNLDIGQNNYDSQPYTTSEYSLHQNQGHGYRKHEPPKTSNQYDPKYYNPPPIPQSQPQPQYKYNSQVQDNPNVNTYRQLPQHNVGQLQSAQYNPPHFNRQGQTSDPEKAQKFKYSHYDGTKEDPSSPPYYDTTQDHTKFSLLGYKPPLLVEFEGNGNENLQISDLDPHSKFHQDSFLYRKDSPAAALIPPHKLGKTSSNNFDSLFSFGKQKSESTPVNYNQNVFHQFTKRESEFSGEEKMTDLDIPNPPFNSLLFDTLGLPRPIG